MASAVDYLIMDSIRFDFCQPLWFVGGWCDENERATMSRVLIAIVASRNQWDGSYWTNPSQQQNSLCFYFEVLLHTVGTSYDTEEPTFAHWFIDSWDSLEKLLILNVANLQNNDDGFGFPVTSGDLIGTKFWIGWSFGAPTRSKSTSIC